MTAAEVASLVFVLGGPQQAWSAAPRRAHRPCQDHPTKSGVIGFVANALGRERDEDITELAALRFAVRADRPGHLETDFHISGRGRFPLLPAEVLADRATAEAAATGVIPERFYAAPKNIRSDGTGKREAAVLTRDQILTDAVFTVALTGPSQVLTEIRAALEAPARVLYLGRRSYPPSRPPAPQILNLADPRAALEATALAVADPPAQITVWAETDPRTPVTSGTRVIADQPTSFRHRRYLPRVETRTTAATGNTESPRETTAVDFFAPEDQP